MGSWKVLCAWKRVLKITAMKGSHVDVVRQGLRSQGRDSLRPGVSVGPALG